MHPVFVLFLIMSLLLPAVPVAGCECSQNNPANPTAAVAVNWLQVRHKSKNPAVAKSLNNAKNR